MTMSLILLPGSWRYATSC